MRKFLLATTALAVLSGIGAASAADLPSRKGPPIAPAYIPAFTWTGFYVGLNAGVGWANNNNNNNNLPLGAIPVTGFVSSGNSNNAGFVGGAQAGYNYQFGVGQGVVIGAETDFQFADISHNRNNQVPFTLAQFPGTTFFPGSGHSSGNYLGTVRGRIGYGWDRVLVYGTGGLAYGDIGRNRNNGVTSVTAAGFAESGQWRDFREHADHSSRHQRLLQHEDRLDARWRRRICGLAELDGQGRISLLQPRPRQQ